MIQVTSEYFSRKKDSGNCCIFLKEIGYRLLLDIFLGIGYKLLLLDISLGNMIQVTARYFSRKYDTGFCCRDERDFGLET